MREDPAVDPVVADANRLAPPVAEGPRPFRRKTWAVAEGQRESAARLAVLPPELDFREDFPEPIRYDEARRQLLYRGFMSYGSFHYLRQLSSDSGYAQALDDLFRSSSIQPVHRPRFRWWIAMWVFIGIGTAAIAWALLF